MIIGRSVISWCLAMITAPIYVCPKSQVQEDPAFWKNVGEIQAKNKTNSHKLQKANRGGGIGQRLQVVSDLQGPLFVTCLYQAVAALVVKEASVFPDFQITATAMDPRLPLLPPFE